MPSFSQRTGLQTLEKIIQRESIDDDLKNSLWSALVIAVYDRWEPFQYAWTSESEQINSLLRNYWLSFFKRPIDNKPNHENAMRIIRDWFYGAKWNEIYDFIEFTAKHSGGLAANLKEICNRFFERESSAYRFVGNEIVEITSKIEISAIEDAISSGPKAVSLHLTRSLALLSDRKSPDFRNSVKESISAVEAICKILAKDEKTTLGGALKQLHHTSPIHPAFEKSLLGLYGFTNDQHGIRHSLLDEPKISYSDAKFMLVLCSGFCSFLLGKASENGIKLT